MAAVCTAMMKATSRLLALTLLGSCSAGPRPTPAAPPATIAKPVAADAATSQHRCLASVWPNYNQSAEEWTDPDPAPADADAAPGDVEEDTAYGGKTRDDLAAEASAAVPIGGVCDTRHRPDVEGAVLAEAKPSPARAGVGWNRRSPPAYRDAVRGALGLTTAEEAKLAQDGFVVAARLGYANYTSAFYDIHRAKLPVFVSAGAILHAVYASHDSLVASLEKAQLVKRLDAALGAMECGLAAATADYPPDTVHDLDVYLTVARSLLVSPDENTNVTSELGNADEVDALVKLVRAADGIHEVELFGRTRNIDASQFTPRGHYTGDLAGYFQAAMWLSRVELNLVSRDSRSSQPGYVPDPSETPREAVDALALADLAQRTGALGDFAALDQAWAALAGARVDVSLADLVALRTKAGITDLRRADTAVRLRNAIGDGWKRTVNTSPMPNVPNLPVIATPIGARFTADNGALDALITRRGDQHDGVEIGYALGHDRAKAFADPSIARELAKARDSLSHVPVGPDLYSSWLAAIRTLATKPAGALPSFMDGSAFADLRLDTALVAYGQLRHDHVLIEAQVYDVGGCEIPDGYVEPVPATYHALADLAAKGAATFGALDPKDAGHGVKYWKRLEQLMHVLETISNDELANRPLSADEKRFLAMIVEERDADAWNYNGHFPIPTYDGWYIDLFPTIDVSTQSAAFVADYATVDRNDTKLIHYLGAKGPELGVFVVDTGGGPRMMVGPVPQGFALTGPLTHRYTDADAMTVAGREPWATSYTVAAPPEPAFVASLQPVIDPSPKPGWGARKPGPPAVLTLDATDDLGDATIELYDHHFVTAGAVHVHVGAGKTDVALPKLAARVEGVRVRIGAFVGRIDADRSGNGSATFGGFTPRGGAPQQQ